MKLLLLVFILALGGGYATETYSSENDNLDIDAVVQNPELFQAFIDCFLDRKDCDNVSGDFKEDISEAVATACQKCTSPQKRIFQKFLDALKAKLPKEYENFTKKYDPEGKYIGPLEKALASS